MEKNFSEKNIENHEKNFNEKNNNVFFFLFYNPKFSHFMHSVMYQNPVRKSRMT